MTDKKATPFGAYSKKNAICLDKKIKHLAEKQKDAILVNTTKSIQYISEKCAKKFNEEFLKIIVSKNLGQTTMIVAPTTTSTNVSKGSIGSLNSLSRPKVGRATVAPVAAAAAGGKI